MDDTEDDGRSGDVVRRMWELIGARDWDGFARVLAPEVRVSYVHTGEELDRDAVVRLNREYPGQWAAELLDLVQEGGRVASRVCVSDGVEVYHVAGFATVRAGRVSELTEVWTKGDQPSPAGARPS